MSPCAPNSTSPAREATVSEARDNLTEALELFFECASPEELAERLHSEVYVTNVEITVG